MKSQSLFAEKKIRKNIVNVSSSEFAHTCSVVKVKYPSNVFNS